MFGKLIKNEFRNIGKLMLLLNLGVIAMHAIMLIFDSIENTGIFAGNILGNLYGTYVVIYIISMLAVNMVVFICFASRFYKKIYSTEGYLTHTLPVKKSQVVNSMLVSASLWTAITAVVSMSYLVFIASRRFEVFNDEFFRILRNFEINGGTVTVMVTATLIGMIAGYMLVFLSISIGQNWKSHPVLGSAAAYWAITGGMQIIGVMGMVAVAKSGLMEKVWIHEFFDSPGDVIVTVGLIAIVLECIVFAIMYVINLMLMKRRLNLQ